MEKTTEQPILKILLDNRGLVVGSRALSKFYERGTGSCANISELSASLTITHRPKIGAPEIAKVFERCKKRGIDYTILPRGRIDVFAHVGAPYRVINRLQTHNIKVGRACLRPNQEIVVDYVCQQLFSDRAREEGRATAVLSMRAGSGKTFVAAGIIGVLGLRTLCIVPRVALVRQTRADFVTAGIWEGSDSSAAGPSSSSGGPAPPPIVIMVINTALCQEDEFFKSFSLVIFDEIQMYCSGTRRKIFFKAQALCTLGMSATVDDRPDGFDMIYKLHLRPVVDAASIPGFEYDSTAEFDCRAIIVNYSGPAEFTECGTSVATGLADAHAARKLLLADPRRREIVVDLIVDLYDWRGPEGQQHCIYVFAEEVEHLSTMRSEMIEMLGKRGRADINVIVPELPLFIGGMREGEIAVAIEKSRILFATYSYAGVGISILKMSAIIFCTPRKANMKQIVPRILRSGSDISIPRVVVDIVDTCTCFRNQFKIRRDAYSLYGFVLSHIKK